MTDRKNSVMETAKVYYPYLDVLKGLAILLMVMGHVIPWTLDKSFIHQPVLSLSGNELYLSLVYKIIYSFHMPLLFFVSGFLFYKPIKCNDKFFQKTLTKRINRILIPYFFTGSLLLISRGHWGYWFLQCLFFMDLLVAALMLITNKYHLNHKKEFILYSVVGAFLYVFGKVFSSLEDETLGIVVIGRLFMYYPAFVLGFFMNKYMKLKEFFMNRYTVFSSFILYIITFILCGTKIPIVGFISSVFLPLTMIVYLYHLCCNNFKSGGVIAYIGRNSMEIYLLHSFFVMIFKEVGVYMISLNSLVTCVTFQIVYSFVISVIAITLSILIANFLKGSSILKRLLFGL